MSASTKLYTLISVIDETKGPVTAPGGAKKGRMNTNIFLKSLFTQCTILHVNCVCLCSGLFCYLFVLFFDLILNCHIKIHIERFTLHLFTCYE